MAIRGTKRGQYRKTSRRAYKPVRRRRRVSGMGKLEFEKIGGIVAGAIGGQFLDGLPMFSTLDPKIQSAFKIALGVFAPQYVKGDFVKGVGDGLIASGSVDLASDFGIVSGVGKYLHGIGQDVPVISATSTTKSRRGQLNELTGATMTFSDADVPTIAGLGALGEL